MNEDLIAIIRQKALEDKVPIMEDPGIEFFTNYLIKENVKTMLEVGTAVGYSSIVFASALPELKIVTLEKDEERFKIANENIAKANLTDRIKTVLTDCREYETIDKFDVIFLDGPKAHNQELFERYEKNLSDNGFFVIDDVYFHGLVDDISQAKTRRLRTMVKKIGAFREDALNNPNYESKYYEIGDGVLICHKKGK